MPPVMCKFEECLIVANYGLKGEAVKHCSKHKEKGEIDNRNKTCDFEGCTSYNRAFSIKGEKAKFCSKHKTDKMIDVRHKRCEYEGCEVKEPCFDIKGGKGRFCMVHKSPVMIDVKHIRCAHKGCDLSASFGIGDGKSLYCSNHKTEDMHDKNRKKCEYNNCKTIPVYGIKGELPRFCKTHSSKDMIDVKSLLCQYDNCKIRANFGKIGQSPKFCKIHKTENDVLLNRQMCKYVGCSTTANYGTLPKKPEFCSIHKEKSMTQSYFHETSICSVENCNNRRRYNIRGESAKFCKDHKTDKMILIGEKECEYKDCTSINPNFDIPGGKGKFCSIHKTEGMINVKTPLCEEATCTTGASYGNPGTSKTHCFQHRKAGMILRPSGKCVDCKEPAVWGTNWIPKHCEDHKQEDETNLLEKPCSSCGLMYILDKDGRCEICNPVAWQRTRLAKQNALMTYLDNRDLKGISTDTTIDGGACGKERPDRIYDFADKIVILECDENQHKERQCVCEQTRMVNIGQSFGGIPVYFIRWNPDDYESKKVPEQIKKRYKLVGDLIESIQNNTTKLPEGALVSAIYMYYDGWTGLADEPWHTF